MTSPSQVEPPRLDRYELVRPLGSGGMGAVYEGRHRITGRRVAVKVLHPTFASDRDIVNRFFNEARAAATMGHPNVVECLDAGVAESGQAYLVLEYLEGRSLAGELEDVRALDPSRAVRIALQVVSALSAAHAHGVVHRDLKPDNIFLSELPGEPDHVTVLDFGISRFHSAGSVRTRAGAVMGTPAYMAPEQLADSSTVDARADIYALGATLYQVLTGSLPFSADSLIALAAKIASEPPRPLERVRAGVPPALARVVLRAMAKSPADRYPTMEAMGAALATAAGFDGDEDARDRTHAPSAPRPPAAESLTEEVELPADAEPAAGRRRLPLAAAAALGLVVLGAFAWRMRPEAPVSPVLRLAPPGPAVAKVEPAILLPAPAVPDAPAVAVGEAVLSVPPARPGLVPQLALVVPHKVSLPRSAKPADWKVLGTVWAQAAVWPPPIRDLEHFRTQLRELAARFPYVGPLHIGRAWLAMTLVEAKLNPRAGGDFTGGGCDAALVDEAVAEIARAREVVDPSVIEVKVVEAATSGYLAYLDAVALECRGRLAEARISYTQALQIGDALDHQFRRSVFLHRTRVALALGDAREAQSMLDEVYEAKPSPERSMLALWAASRAGNCTGVLREARAVRGHLASARSPIPAWLDRLELACLLDPAGGQAGSDPRLAEPGWGAGEGARHVEEARRLFDDVATPAAALRSALRLCYFRDRVGVLPGDALTLTVAGRFEQPRLSGAAPERLEPLQTCLGVQLAASKLRGPIAVSPLQLRVANGP